MPLFGGFVEAQVSFDDDLSLLNRQVFDGIGIFKVHYVIVVTKQQKKIDGRNDFRKIDKQGVLIFLFL